MIQNTTHLCNEKTKNALDILDAGLQAALPERLADLIGQNTLVVGNKSYSLSKRGKIYVVSVGKAADSMAKTICSKLKADGGIIVVPKNYDSTFKNSKFKIHHASHPIPDKSSVLAAKSILNLLQNADKNDFVLFLISGGASALVCLPEGISLAQKQEMTKLVLKCGATIDEINCIRKHLSAIKGGKLIQNLSCQAVSLVMSDVVGNDLASIASGLTYFDNSTFSDCMRIIEKYRLAKKTPSSVLKRFKLGVDGRVSETPKKPKILNFIVATNNDCVSAMTKKATSLGYKTKTLAPISGDVDVVAKKILQNFSNRKKSCLVFGGEPTVRVTGRGKGGRNQELVLRILQNLDDDSVIVASVGTDGVDGNTKYAGAISGFVPNKNEIATYLKENNSCAFFKKHKGLILTGPTHTNLMDVGLIMRS